MLKTIKIRLYPNKEEKIYMNQLIGSCRFVYNKCLSYKIEKYNSEKKSVGFKEIGKYLTYLKTVEEFKWLKNSHSKVLQQSLINLEYAYKSFFKNGMGFPKFKSKKNNKQSCRFPVDAIMGITGNRINITQKLKNIHFKCSIKDEVYLNKHINLIKSATLIRTKTDNYYFSILIERNNDKKFLDTSNIIGIDLGIKNFIVTSNNEKIENIKIKRNNEVVLKKLHRKLSKKQINSKNREKSRIKLSKYYEKLNNIKDYYLHKTVNKLLNENQVLIMENLNVNEMMKNHNLAKSIQELSLYKFKCLLKYKSEWYNKDIIEIDRFYPSSKLCNVCGHINHNLELKNREWTCPSCNTEHDRDLNAAMNIRKEGGRILKIGLSSPDLKPLEIEVIQSLN
jgi:putative transposase